MSDTDNTTLPNKEWGYPTPYEYSVGTDRGHCHKCLCWYPANLNWQFCPFCGTRLSELPQIRIGPNFTGDIE